MKISRKSLLLSLVLGVLGLAERTMAGPSCTATAGTGSVAVNCDNHDSGPDCSCSVGDGKLNVSCSMGGPVTTNSVDYSGAETTCSTTFSSFDALDYLEDLEDLE